MLLLEVSIKINKLELPLSFDSQGSLGSQFQRVGGSFCFSGPLPIAKTFGTLFLRSKDAL